MTISSSDEEDSDDIVIFMFQEKMSFLRENLEETDDCFGITITIETT